MGLLGDKLPACGLLIIEFTQGILLLRMWGDELSTYSIRKMKKIRLKKDAYSQKRYPCHITIRTKRDEEIFLLDKFTKKCMQLFDELCKQYAIKPFAYCFMPNHLHMIIAVEGVKSIIEYVQAFKSKATLESYNHGFEGKILQSRFYDKFIRRYQELNTEIMYVMQNPVRAGIVRDFRDYPYSKCYVELDIDL